MEPSREKKRLRRSMHERLGALAEDERSVASARVTERCLRLEPVAGARSVLACLSFGIEPDSWHLVGRLVERGVEVWVPRIVRGESRMRLHRYPCDLEALPFGLRQPDGRSPQLSPAAIEDRLDAAIVLGLAFARSSLIRLGHGGGYFDRFFDRHQVLAVGLGFEIQMVPSLPTEKHDRPMGAVVTEARVYR